jgi:hypothetical protein
VFLKPDFNGGPAAALCVKFWSPPRIPQLVRACGAFRGVRARD